VELDVPVRIYCAMNYATDRPYDIGHPRHIDTVAVDFPELRIDAGLGGWPWVNELIGILRRHPNLMVDTTAHRPRYFGVSGSGWEQFLHFGNTALQDRVMVGVASTFLGMEISDIIDEYASLPLKDSVLERWLFSNAQAFFRWEGS
jgi:predicted TIM-barrel fold metal-dependent hydrolase